MVQEDSECISRRMLSFEEDMKLAGVRKEDAEDRGWMEADDLRWRCAKSRKEKQRKKSGVVTVQAYLLTN